MWSVTVAVGLVHDKENPLMTTLEVDCDTWTTPCGFLFQNLGKLILHVVLETLSPMHLQFDRIMFYLVIIRSL